MPPFSCESNENNSVLLSTVSNPVSSKNIQKENETMFASSCSPFQCLENSVCLDIDSLSSFWDWIGLRDDEKTDQFDSQINNNLDSIKFSNSSSNLRAPTFSLQNQVSHDQFDKQYALSHELLIDCLLEEARDRKLQLCLQDKRPLKNKLAKISPSKICVDPLSTSTSCIKLNQVSGLPSTRHEQSHTRKRRKKVKVPKLLEKKRIYKQNFNDSPYQKMYDEPVIIEDFNDRKDSFSNLSLSIGSESAIEVIHPDAVLQKDKGLGSPIGENISARGRSETLQKLREKMDIMVEVEGNKASTVLKRVNAVEFQIDHDTVETRSIIGIKMGFVGVKYGILLRWKHDGMIHTICLRKMCPESFMKGSKRTAKSQNESSRRILNQSQSSLLGLQSSSSTLPYAHGQVSTIPHSLSFNTLDLEDLQLSPNKSKNDYQESLTKANLPLLQPPYFISRPDAFPPATLEVTVLRARGLQAKIGKRRERRIDSCVRVSIGNESQETDIVRRSRNPVFGTKNGDNHFILNCSMDSLLVEILDFRNPKRSRLIAFCTFPLSLVEAHPANGHIPAKEVTLPCKMICVPEGPNGCYPFGSVTLSLIRRDSYTCWKKKELRERTKHSRRKQTWYESKFLDGFKAIQ